MTGDMPNRPPRPFGPDELDGVTGIRPDELAAEARIARDLEGVSARGGMRPSADFTDRVMGAVAVEPLPAPVIAAGSALRHGAALGFLASIRDSFRVAFGRGFPVAVRAQALALVLVVSGVVAGSGLATAGAVGLLDDRGSPSPAPSVAAPSPSELSSPTPAPMSSPDATFDATSPSATPSSSPGPTESEAIETQAPDETDDPTATDESDDPTATDENGEDSGDVSAGTGSDQTPAPVTKTSSTPRPTGAPTARPTASPTEEPGETNTPKPAETPHLGGTPSPTPTPHSD
jgi:hypothetical protein